LGLLAIIIRDNADPEYNFDPDKGNRSARHEDYEHIDIIPVSDPNAATMSQRVVQYQAVIQMAQMAPDIYDLPQLHRRMLEVLGIKNPDKLIPLPDDEKPKDPVSENMAMLRGEPMKAFMHQDHEAHIATHTSFMQDPMIAGTIGQNPMAQQIMASLQAHIAEHLGFAYRRQIEERLGVSMPAPDAEMPPEMEVQLSRLVAQASQQLLAIHKGDAAQQKATEQAQDPLVQIQQQELQIKQGELQLKVQESQAKLQIAQAELQLKAQELQAKTALDAAKVESSSALAKSRTKLDGIKAASDMYNQQQQSNTREKTSK
jgi:hypothetical protein